MRFVSKGAVVDVTIYDGCTPLYIACQQGNAEMASLLINSGAAVNQPRAIDRNSNDGVTPLLIACLRGHTRVASILLTSGAAVNQARASSTTPTWLACSAGHLDCVQLLSSYGASRAFVCGRTAEQVALSRGHDEVVAWLVNSRLWCTPLHHLTSIGERARALLRGGADLNAAAWDGPTPLTLASDLSAAGNAPVGSAAHLVLRPAQNWSEVTHELFPEAARAQAVALLLLGYRLSRQDQFSGQEIAFSDVWVHHVMPRAVRRVSSLGARAFRLHTPFSRFAKATYSRASVVANMLLAPARALTKWS
uniref:Uncharacterized protein n=1 Tax=Haptolina ericina TaxID=156174 RepID=A0A7S3B400_9EUKA|mmetsp:Transcript_46673/g.105245  ORF Transcript_46673/g.105245 Transcript_46673/m.105245 type:complete len:307 (+) Transcript_46673:195-1115(+)